MTAHAWCSTKTKALTHLQPTRIAVEDESKTPVLVDNSEDEKVKTFFGYKGILEDLSGFRTREHKQKLFK